MAEGEFGLNINGAITLPCDSAVLDCIMSLTQKGILADGECINGHHFCVSPGNLDHSADPPDHGGGHYGCYRCQALNNIVFVFTGFDPCLNRAIRNSMRKSRCRLVRRPVVREGFEASKT
ncbi:hypothetical protein EJ110_NYTH51050 [Nymphaea thermarum]|nr:hypothetical protein EJ110_NYTH51050 [Nymphaea thermarum]